MNATHPADGALLALAQNELTGTEHAETLAHLSACQQCRSTVQDTRDLIGQAKSDVVPAASPALLARIQATRAAGVRITLDGDTSSTRTRHTAMRVIAWSSVAAAAVLTIMLARSASDARDQDVTRRQASRGVNPESLRAASSAARVAGVNASVTAGANGDATDALLDAFSPFPTVAVAQGAPTSDENSAPLVEVDASAFRPGTWSYTEYRVTDGTLARPIRMSYMTLAEEQLKGHAVWRLIETTVAHVIGVDTLWLDKATFRPIQRRWNIGHMSFREDFSANHVDFVTHMAAHGPNTREYTNAHRATVNETGSVIALEAQLRLALRTQKLHAKWRGVFGMPGPVAGADAGKPGRMALYVDGSANIKTENDDVPCWRVVSTGTQVWYVSKRSGEVVRSEISIGSMNERRLDLFTTP